jgi:DNA-binding MarR family transcriptional regulator
MASVTNTDARLRQLAAASHVLSRTLRRGGEIQVGLDPLPLSEYDVLEFVGAHPGASVSDVARGLRLQTSNVSNTVRQLVRRGLLERTVDARDQRRVLLRLTAVAEGHGELLRASWASALAGLLPSVSERDAELLLAAAPALARLADLAATAPAPPGLAPDPTEPAASAT